MPRSDSYDKYGSKDKSVSLYVRNLNSKTTYVQSEKYDLFGFLILILFIWI